MANGQSIISALDWYRRALALGLATTLLVTYRLWLGSREFPLIPLVPGVPHPPFPVDHILIAVVLAALAAMAFLHDPRVPLWTVTGIGLLWALLDQSRWQPYFIELLVMIAALPLLGWRDRERIDPVATHWALAPARLLLVFTYVFAGLQKLNHDFVTWLFLGFFEPVLVLLGIDSQSLNGSALVGALAVGAALLEAGSGMMLLFKRTRRIAVVLLILIHLSIFVVVGLLGHNTNYSILAWNFAMVLALWILFRTLDPAAEGVRHPFGARWWKMLLRGGEGETPPPRAPRFATLVVLVLFGLMPILGLLGHWDAYLSFALYSGNTYDALFLVASGDRAALPPSALRALRPDGTLSAFDWSMEDTGAQLYPELRVLISIGRSLALMQGKHDVYLRYAEPPNRFTGERAMYNIRFARGTGEAEEVELPGK